jgi:hypothetical protein
MHWALLVCCPLPALWYWLPTADIPLPPFFRISELSLCYSHSSCWLTLHSTASSCHWLCPPIIWSLSNVLWCTVLYLNYCCPALFCNTTITATALWSCIFSSQSQSYIMTDGRMASLSLCQAPIWEQTNLSVPFIIFRQVWICLHCMPSLMRGQICSSQLLLGLAIAVFLVSESQGTHDHILLS